MRLALALAASMLVASGARAQPLDDAQKRACADAYDNSQVLRDEGQLMLARAQLEICRRACPQALALDCERWQRAVDARLPSVRLSASDERGEAVAARVRIDDGPAEPLPAGDVLLAPGEHRFVFERIEDGQTVERVIALAEGDKARAVRVRFAAAGEEDGAGGVAAIALASIGGAALIVAGSLAIKGHVDRGALFDCKPSCRQEDVDAVATTWTISGVLAGIGGAALGAALVVWLVADGDDAETALGPARLTLLPAGMSLRF